MRARLSIFVVVLRCALKLSYGQIKQYLESVNSRALGVYHEWYANGQQKVEALVIGGVADQKLAVQMFLVIGDMRKIPVADRSTRCPSSSHARVVPSKSQLSSGLLATACHDPSSQVTSINIISVPVMKA